MRKGVTDDQDMIAEVLDKAEILWLALVDEQGPHSVPVNFGMVDGVIYLHSGLKGRKVDALDSGAPLAFSAVIDIETRHSDTACGMGYSFRSIMGRGTPRMVEGEEERMAGLDAITLKHAGRPLPYSEKALKKTRIYAIDIDSVTGRIKE